MFSLKTSKTILTTLFFAFVIIVGFSAYISSNGIVGWTQNAEAIGGGGGNGSGGGDGPGGGDGGGIGGGGGNGSGSSGGIGGGGGNGCGGCGAPTGGGSPSPAPAPAPAPAPSPSPSPAPGGSGSDLGPVRDPVPVSTPAPTCTFDSSPSTVEPGDTTTLSWNTSNATRVDINRGVGSNLALDGSQSVRLGNSSEVYTLTATGPGGSAVCVEVVRVSDIPDAEPAECTFFDAEPRRINEGDDSTLTWATEDGDELEIEDDRGRLIYFSRNSSEVRSDFIEVSPRVDTTYTLTVFNDEGSDDCSVTIRVDDEPREFEPICRDFDADDTRIEEGDSVRLTWETEDGDELEIEDDRGRLIYSTRNDSDVRDGSVRVEPRDDTEYTLIVSNDEGDDECSVTVRVDEDRDRDRDPICREFEVSDRRIEDGDSVRLSWETEDGDELTIEDDRGRTIYHTRDDDDVEDGSVRVEPRRDTEYTLIVENDDGDDECDVDVDVDDEEFVVIEERDQQPYIALNAVPYTGFDAGFMLKSIFYGLLALWGLFVAYMFAIKRDSVFGIPLRPVVARHDNDYTIAHVSPFSQTVGTTDSTTVPTPNVEQKTETPTDTFPQNLPTDSARFAALQQSANGGVAAQNEINAAAEVLSSNDVAKELEDRAHERKILISSDALRHFVAVCPREVERVAYLDRIIDTARVSYPTEDGWVVLNLERMEELCAKEEGYSLKDIDEKDAIERKNVEAILASTPEGVGSLAEAIVTGNITAAYQMLGNRPMVALADATADLDALYRFKQGNDNGFVSEMLKTETLDLPSDTLRAAIDALGSALDGSYNDEESAVKMAIVQAVKALNVPQV